jgi:peptidoglycan/xylan/chitin deacetylase (PgdA/CDA1 family)
MLIHLTFDDGPGPQTEPLLDILYRAGVRATFFIVGKNLRNPQWTNEATTRAILIRAIKNGHELGNHTLSHRWEQSEREFVQDVIECDMLIADLYNQAGIPPPSLIRFRLPYGVTRSSQTAFSNGLFGPPQTIIDMRMNILAGLGKTHFHWTSGFDDWLPETDSTILCERMVAHAMKIEKYGLSAVLDLHDFCEPPKLESRAATVDAVSKFLVEARTRGWDFFQPA